MYAIYAYIGVVLGVNVGIYGIHGVSGYGVVVSFPDISGESCHLTPLQLMAAFEPIILCP